MTADPWRWRCPEGHASWVSRSTAPSSERYRCDVCGAVFGDLVDARELATAGGAE